MTEMCFDIDASSIRNCLHPVLRCLMEGYSMKTMVVLYSYQVFSIFVKNRRRHPFRGGICINNGAGHGPLSVVRRQLRIPSSSLCSLSTVGRELTTDNCSYFFPLS